MRSIPGTVAFSLWLCIERGSHKWREDTIPPLQEHTILAEITITSITYDQVNESRHRQARTHAELNNWSSIHRLILAQVRLLKKSRSHNSLKFLAIDVHCWSAKERKKTAQPAGLFGRSQAKATKSVEILKPKALYFCM
jgi:hypothetical protein